MTKPKKKDQKNLAAQLQQELGDMAAQADLAEDLEMDLTKAKTRLKALMEENERLRAIIKATEESPRITDQDLINLRTIHARIEFDRLFKTGEYVVLIKGMQVGHRNKNIRAKSLLEAIMALRKVMT